MPVTPKQKANLKKGGTRSPGRPKKDESTRAQWEAISKKLIGAVAYLADHAAREVETARKTKTLPRLDWPLVIKAAEVSSKLGEEPAKGNMPVMLVRPEELDSAIAKIYGKDSSPPPTRG